MKIAVWHNLPSGGGKRALYNQIAGLVERGHVVEAWCPTTADQTFLPLQQIIIEHTIPFSYKPLRSKLLIAQSLIRLYNETKQVKAMDVHCQQCAEQINCGNFDLLFATSCRFFRVTSIGRYVKIPKVIYLHEPNRKLYEAMPELVWVALPYSKTFFWSLKYFLKYIKDVVWVQWLRVKVREELLNIKEFNTILVNSFFSRESVIRTYGLEAKVCYLGVDTKTFYPTSVSHENFVVGLGGIHPSKGLDLAVRAIATIEEQKRPSLVWIGNFSKLEYQKEIEVLAASLGVNVTFKIDLVDSEIVDILSRSSLMIYTSRLEPFGLSLLEANSCGTPVVAIAEGGVRESVKNGINGVLIDDNDAETMGRAILQIIERPELVNEMGIKAREYVLKQWKWETSIDRLENCFSNVLNLLKSDLEKADKG